MKRPILSSVIALAALPSLAAAHTAAHTWEPRLQVDPRLEPVEEVVAQGWNDPRGGNLDAALRAIQINKVRSDIFFIASDDMAGRDSPSPGLRIAARFIRARLQRLGWEPGAPEGSYFYNYELTQHALNESRTFAELTLGRDTLPLQFGRDYYLSSGGDPVRDGSGDIVYGGSFEEDEIEAEDVKGKWVLLERGTRLSRRRSRAAQELGVLGFIVLADPDAEKTVAESFERTTRYMKQPSLRGSRGGGVPMVSLNEALSAQVEKAAGKLRVGKTIKASFREVWTVEAQPLKLENVCGLWPGSDPKLRNEVIIVSAHYDHVGTNSAGDIFNGADDNGSGTTGLLAIAEALEAYGPMRRTVMLMWVSAEEKGLLGSAAWTKNPWLPEGMKPLCNINIDMIGRNAGDEIGITPTKDRPEYNRLTQLVEKHMGVEGFNTLNSADAYWGRSDHANFSKNLKIPVAFLFSDVHEDYHKATDTPDKINLDKLSRVARLVVRVLHDLQADELDF